MKATMLRSIIILSGLILLIGFAVVLPTLLSIHTLREDIGSTQLQMERQYQQRQALRETTANLQAIRGIAGTLNRYAIREGDELRFIQSLENIAGRHGIEQDIQLETANQKDLTAWEKVVPLTITLKGAFPDVLRYLRDAETLNYDLQLDALQFTELSPGAGGGQGDIQVRIIGRVHWLSRSAPDFVWGS
jgi:hypothetical protein